MEFKDFGKIPRLNREVVVTEKIDGTNACVVISDDGNEITAQSKSKLITPANDNYGFARWVHENRDALLKLGPGHHFGEWWGQGINRNYGLSERRFSLFNTSRWKDSRPECCFLVPVIATGIGYSCVQESLDALRREGSRAVPGFKNPEGVIAFHTAGNLYFKATLEKDDEWKGKTGT